MPDNRIPKQLFCGEPCQKVSLKDFNISTESWESLASERPCWHHLITKGANTVEESRRQLHARPKPPATPAQHPHTTAQPVGEVSSSGLASSALSGHTEAALLTDWGHGHLRLQRTNNNNNNNTFHNGRETSPGIVHFIRQNMITRLNVDLYQLPVSEFNDFWCHSSFCDYDGKLVIPKF